jgi:purine-binding chemotaxis protein CheW
VRHIPVKDIQPSLPTLTGIREEYLRGITKDFIVILDIDKFLSDKKIVVHEEVT